MLGAVHMRYLSNNIFPIDDDESRIDHPVNQEAALVPSEAMFLKFSKPTRGLVGMVQAPKPVKRGASGAFRHGTEFEKLF